MKCKIIFAKSWLCLCTDSVEDFANIENLGFSILLNFLEI